MGYTFCGHQTKKELIASLTTDGEIDRHLKGCVRGDMLWTIKQDTTTHKERIIGFILQYESACGWGYKPVAEEQGPTDLSCPQLYLDLVPAPGHPYAREWRAGVRAKHAQRKRVRAKLAYVQVGDRLWLKPGYNPAYVVVEKFISDKTLIGSGPGNRRYRVTSSDLRDF